MTPARLSLFWLPFVAILSLWFSLPLAAQTTEEPEPDTIVISDTLHHDDVERLSTFTGDVVMTRGQLVLHSDRLDLYEDEDGFQYGVATLKTSDRVRVRQENPEDFEIIRGEGLRAEWDGKAEERSEEHTSELQSRGHLVCRLLLEKKKKNKKQK